MKRILIIISCFLTFICTGGFICVNQKMEQNEKIALKQMTANQITGSMTSFTPNPMVGFPLY